MESKQTLCMLKQGEKANITRLLADDVRLEAELREIGFAEGDEVEVLARGAFGGSPVSVRLNRTIIALRGNEAAAVEVCHQ